MNSPGKIMIHKNIKIIAQSLLLSMPLFAISMHGDSNPSATSTTAAQAANQAANNGAAAPSITSSNLTQIKLQIPGDNQDPVLLPSVAIGLSAVLKAQAGLADSMTSNRDLFVIEPIEDKALLEKFVQLLKLFAMQKYQPIVTDMRYAYSCDKTINHSVAINRILERLELRDLIQVLRAGCLLALPNPFNCLIVHCIADQLTLKHVMYQCFTEPDLLNFIFDNFPDNFVPLLRQELLKKSGYLLWGCLSNLARPIVGTFDNNTQSRSNAGVVITHGPKFSLIIQSKKNNAILGTFPVRSDFSISSQCKVDSQEKIFIVLRNWDGERSMSLTDIATKKNICKVNPADCRWTTIEISPDNLTIGPKSEELTAMEIKTVADHLSTEQLYFLMLFEHAHLNNLSVSIKSQAKLESLYDSLDAEIRENHFDVRYKRLLQEPIQQPKYPRWSHCAIM